MARRPKVPKELLDGARSLGINLPPELLASESRPSKYRSERVEYDGLLYDSRAEAARARELDAQRAAGVIRGWIRQVPFRLGVPENVYRVDFLVFHLDGTVHAEDTKGHRTDKFNRDVKLWARYGPCELHIIHKGQVEVVDPCREVKN
jgi:hypothetical protein